MKKTILMMMFVLMAAVAPVAQSPGDTCHVYIVDVVKGRKAFDEYRDAGNPEKDGKALRAAQTLFQEFRTVIGEEELTKTYPFPGSDLVITASVYYTDESMASAGGADSMLLGIVVSPKPQKDATSAEGNAVAEATDYSVDTVRAKKNMKVRGREYLVGIECHRKKMKKAEADSVRLNVQ